MKRLFFASALLALLPAFTFASEHSRGFSSSRGHELVRRDFGHSYYDHRGGSLGFSFGFGPRYYDSYAYRPYYAPSYYYDAPVYVEPAPVYVDPAPVYVAPRHYYGGYDYYRPGIGLSFGFGHYYRR